MLLFSSHSRGDVKPLAKKLINVFGSFASVMQAEIAELAAVENVGNNAIAAIKSVKASAELMLKQKAMSGSVISSWMALLDYCKLTMGAKKREEFRIIFLNNKNSIIKDEVQNEGTVNHTPAYPREIIRRALELGASAIILAHNHPSGDASPSAEDISLTNAVIKAANALEVKIYDHLIIANNGYFSFKSNGLM